MLPLHDLCVLNVRTYNRKFSYRYCLSAAKQLRHSQNFKNVFINPDLTKAEREKNKLLRSEVKRRRDAGEKVFLRGGQIIEVQERRNFH